MPPTSGTPLAGYAFESERTNHISYIDRNLFAHELYRSGGNWAAGVVSDPLPIFVLNAPGITQTGGVARRNTRFGDSSGDETGCPVIRVFNDAGNVIETHEHAGD